ncbi:MAG: YybH family protein [Pirellulaceae bacterium]
MRVCNLVGLNLVLCCVAATAVAQSPTDTKEAKPVAAAAPAAAASSAAATPAAAAKDADLAAIRRAAVEFETAFNSGNAKAVAAHWTEDGDYTADSGQLFSGRNAIEKQYSAVLAASKGLKLKIVIDSLRLLSDSAAIEDGRAILDPAPAGSPAYSKYTAVHVKVGGKWLMSTVRDTRIETQSAYNKVNDLEFLIGTWVAEEHGAKTESVCRWVANKSFVERTYTVTHADQTKTSGVQIIGHNPQGDHVQSWNFSSDGGFAVGVWSPRENGWSAEISGISGSGLNTTAVNLLTRMDNNAYVWQSVDRTIGGQSLPDTDEVVLKRQTK